MLSNRISRAMFPANILIVADDDKTWARASDWNVRLQIPSGLFVGHRL